MNYWQNYSKNNRKKFSKLLINSKIMKVKKKKLYVQ